MKKLLLSTVAIATITTAANAGKNVMPAPTPVVPVQEPATSFNLVGLQIGTLGVGANFAMPINKNLQARLNINGLKVDKTKTKDNITYDASLKLFTAGLLLDIFPSESSTFHISVGAYYNKNKVTGKAKPKNGQYTINNNTYTAQQLGRLDASLTFKKFAPYIGLGWGGKLDNSGWSWNFDIGVMYHGTPKATLTPVRGSALAHNGDPAHDAAVDNTWNNLVSDVQKEENTINKDIKKYKFYPVVSLGFVYRF